MLHRFNFERINMPPSVTIHDIQVILTQPTGQRLVVVKIQTSEPGLYGLGCATFTQRAYAVQAAIEKHLKPLLIGRDVSQIEELWQLATVNGYWRNGPVLNNAISGIDIALWDIKGKMANMPVYQLLGGTCREAAAVYVHADGRDAQEVTANAQQALDQGYRYVRIQMGGYGGKSAALVKPEHAADGVYYDPREYARKMLNMIEWARGHLSENAELIHDIHERLSPIDTINFAKDAEQFKLFFLEDALAPEDIEWFENIRHQCSTPLAMGELFNNPHEWRQLIVRHLIDFIRIHISQIGGITPARNVAILGNMYGVRTAWHGPADVSPVGHAANLHLDLWSPNFGIQEWCRFPELVYEMFPGCPVVRNGYMYPNEQPALAIEINQSLPTQYPCTDHSDMCTQTRLPDGSPARP